MTRPAAFRQSDLARAIRATIRPVARQWVSLGSSK